ncbi:glutamine amidotransferases class-II-domain-containing protein [Phakopsora pachyrhizi]|nr:glutamine amidotransferases class-II-domain-containing protein [Phakopsora pachyrhizi]
MMLVPEAWQNTPDMDPDKVAFYQWAACLMEPWDGPVLFTFANGCYCGANLDCNGSKAAGFGYTFEQLDLLMRPMVTNGKEALGSMVSSCLMLTVWSFANLSILMHGSKGNDASLACMATQPRLISGE